MRNTLLILGISIAVLSTNLSSQEIDFFDLFSDEISVNFQVEEFKEVVQELQKSTTMDFIYPDLLDRREVYLKLNNVHWQSVLDVILQMWEYSFYERNGIIHILSDEDFEKLDPDIYCHHPIYVSMEDLKKFVVTNRFAEIKHEKEESMCVGVHPKYFEEFVHDLNNFDSPFGGFPQFPREPNWPTNIQLDESLNSHANQDENQFRSTHVVLVNWVPVTLLSERIKRDLGPFPDDAFLVRETGNSMVVTLSKNDRIKVNQYIAILDDKKWYLKQ